MRGPIQSFLAAVFFIVAPVPFAAAQAETPSEVSRLASWIGMPEATGDWGGYRDKLKTHGITLSSSFTTDLSGNPCGGHKQTFTYAGFLSLASALDLEKLLSIKGMSLTVSNYLASGRDLSAAVGNFFDVQQIYTAGNYYFGQLNLAQSLFGDTVTLESGRLFAGDVFATSPLWRHSMNAGLNDNFGAIKKNIFFPHYRTAAWGARISYEPTRQWNLVTAIYNADPNVAAISAHGTDFSFRGGNGFLTISQLTFKHHQNREEKGLPGSASFGGYYESSKFQDLADSTKVWRGGAYGLYLTFDQMIHKGGWPDFEGPSHMRSQASYAERAKHPYRPHISLPSDRPEGLTFWSGAYLAPQQHINLQIFELAAGFSYQGLPPSRSRDVTTLCVMLGRFSPKLSGQNVETVLELNHKFQAGPWFYLTPDIQYVIQPDGRDTIRNALALGLEASVNF